MSHRPRITRRRFVQCAAAGAASVYIHGCTAPSRRADGEAGASARAAQHPSHPIDRDTFRRLADVALDETSADHAFVALHDRTGGLTQFSDSLITDHVDDRVSRIAITVAFDQQVGSASAAELTADAVTAAVKQAEQTAQAALPDQDYLPPLSPQRYPVLATYRRETAVAGGARRAADAPEIVRLYAAQGLRASGIVATSTEAVGIAADTGLFAFERRTLAELDVRSSGSDQAVVVANANRSIDDLQPVERTRRAVARARWLGTQRKLPPGKYTVILEPTAVAQFLRPVLDAADARSHLGHPSVLGDKVGRQIADSRLTLRNRPDHPALLGSGFDASGLPANARPWIEHGVLRQLYYDRRTAREHDAAPTFAPDAWHLSGVAPAGESVDDLIRTTEHGILVCNLDRVRCEDHTDLTLSGRTSHGTFLIDSGEIVGSLVNLEWRESPLRVFNRLSAFTTPLDAVLSRRSAPAHAVTRGVRKMLVPAIKLREFTVSG
jgi:predicted Zn-dependent protease